MRRRLRGRTELESEAWEAGAKADEVLCDEGLTERLESAMTAAESATKLDCELYDGFASVRGFDQHAVQCLPIHL